MAVITIDIISDFVCVWCYIGKRTLEKAIAIHQKTYPGAKHDTFSITWQPYYLGYYNLASSTGGQSVDKSEVAKIKLRDTNPEKLAAMTNRVNQACAAVGINFKPGGKIGSTRDAHQLLHHCQTKYPFNIQNALVDKLFEAHHELEKDISSREVLSEIASDAGLSKVEVDELLGSELYANLMNSEAQRNRERVTNGVPTFFVQGEHRVDGAQDLGEFLEAFMKVKEAEQGTQSIGDA